jgi:hypothetical protein
VNLRAVARQRVDLGEISATRLALAFAERGACAARASGGGRTSFLCPRDFAIRAIEVLATLDLLAQRRIGHGAVRERKLRELGSRRARAVRGLLQR